MAAQLAVVSGTNVFAPSAGFTFVSPAVPAGNTFFTANNLLIVTLGDVGGALNTNPSTPVPTPFTVTGTSHWTINGKPMARFGDLGPPLAGCTANGANTHLSV